jgi:hypothetical protein
LRGIEITRPNQVWAMDITYIPMAHGFVNSSTFGISIGDNGEVILDTIDWNCNTSNAANTGAIMGHNNAIFDLVGPHLFIGNGTNCSAIWMDGPSCMSVANGITVSNTFGDITHFDEGGKGSFSGVIAPSGATVATRAFYLNGGAQAIIGTQMQTTGWTSIGASVASFCSCIHLNGTTIAGGTPGTAFGGQVA